MSPEKEKKIAPKSKSTEWLEGFIHQLRVDKTMLETGTANEEKQLFYQRLADGDTYQLLKDLSGKSNEGILKIMISDYLKELLSIEVSLNHLSIDLGKARILIWAEIHNDDEETEDWLLLTEAKVNYKYQDSGYHISTTIVEEEEGLEVPPHYQLLLEAD